MTFSSTGDRAGSETWLCSIDGIIVGDRKQHQVHHQEVQAKHVETAKELFDARVAIGLYKAVVADYRDVVKALENQLAAYKAKYGSLS